LNYQPLFNAMLWMWLVSIILQCGFKHVNSGLLCSGRWCLWLWRIWQLFNIEIFFDKLQFMDEVIDLKFVGSSQGIMYTCNKQHPPHWKWLQVMWLCMFRRSYLLSIFVGGMRLLDVEGPCVKLCAMSSSQCGWPNWPILGHYTCWFTVYVLWAVNRNCHYVGLWSVFKRMTHGMFDIAFELDTNWQMVLPLVHPINVVPTIT
jgi:hypothetical protein